MAQLMLKQRSDPAPKNEYRDVPVTNKDGQSRDRLIEINSNMIRILQLGLFPE